MKMNEDDRKKLEKFWRRKLWLGLAAVGAIGLAAWRVSVVQGRYDEVLIQESRELPEKVYQELIAEVRKGVPIVPVIPEGIDVTRAGSSNGSRCYAIAALGYLRDPRAISELRKILDNDLNRSASCQLYNVPYLESQVNSAYGEAAASIAQFQSRDSITYLKQALLKSPSSELIDIWREMHDRDHYLNNIFTRSTELSLKEIVSQYSNPLPNFGSKSESQKRNQTLLKSIRETLLSQEKIQELSRISRQENIPKEDVNLAKEELSKDYAKQVLKRQNNVILRLLMSNPQLNDTETIDIVVSIVQDKKWSNNRNTDYFSNDNNFAYSDGIYAVRKRSRNPEFQQLLFQKIKQNPALKQLISSSLEFNFLSFDRKRSLNFGKKYDLSTKNIPSLIRGLESEDIDVRNSSAETLGAIGDINLLNSILVKRFQNKDYAIILAILHGTKPLLYAQSAKDFQITLLLINSLKSLNLAKDIPVEDWIQQNGQTGDSPLAYPLLAWSFVSRQSMSKYPDRIKAIETLQVLADRNALTEADRNAAIPVLMSIYKNWNSVWNVPDRAKVVRLIRTINESEKIDRTAQQRAQQFFYLETGILGAIGLTSLILLFTNLRLRNPYPFTWSGYLLFPEEVIAELIALAQRRKTEKRSKWQIRLEITYEVLLLLWAFHISIRIENMKLPPGGNRSAK